MIRAGLMVEPGAEDILERGTGDGLREWRRSEIAIEDDGVDDRITLLVVGGAGEKERGLLADGSVNAAVEINGVIRWLRAGVGIARVEAVVVAAELEVAVELVAARFGEDLDAAQAERIILCREGILVDTNFADGRLGRKAAAGEAVDVDLRGMPAFASSHSEKLFLQVIIAGGEHVEIAAVEH